MPDPARVGKNEVWRMCDVIAPIITSTYGQSGIADALIAHLAEKLAADEWDTRGRQHSVMLTCWNWFSGGSTAESVAARIEEALNA